MQAPLLSGHDIRGLLRREAWPAALGRRLLTITAQWLLTLVLLVLAPVALPLLAGLDLLARRPWLWLRFYVVIALILVGQAAGMVALFGAWLASWGGRDWERCNRWSFAAECIWADWNAKAMQWVYQMKYEVEGLDCYDTPGATLTLVRHASINDTILPIALVSPAKRIRFRIVLKHELLYAPLVDAIGHRFPTAFVKRTSNNPMRERNLIGHLGKALHGQETVMIFPEGTRFSTARRARLLESLAVRDPRAHARALEFTHVLPLRLGGTFALLEQAPEADVVFCAHTGFEESTTLADFCKGGLYRAVVKVRFWRVARAQIPEHEPARTEFFAREWQKVNAFVAAQQRASRWN